MRKEPYGVGSFVHVIKRGTRGASIVRDNADKNRFLLMLAHFNDEYQPANWFRDIDDPNLSLFERPSQWPKQKKLVHIITFCLFEFRRSYGDVQASDHRETFSNRPLFAHGFQKIWQRFYRRPRLCAGGGKGCR